MKIFKKMIVLASATLAQDVADSNTNSTKSIGGMGLERQYTDLLKLVKHYSPEFDVRKYWAYGCNCLIMGDLPMSGPGYGQPVDALDMICKQYKVKYIKGSPDPSHFIFEINVGKRRIRHITTLNLTLQLILVDLEIHHSIADSLYVGSASFRH